MRLGYTAVFVTDDLLIDFMVSVVFYYRLYHYLMRPDAAITYCVFDQV